MKYILTILIFLFISTNVDSQNVLLGISPNKNTYEYLTLSSDRFVTYDTVQNNFEVHDSLDAIGDYVGINGYDPMAKSDDGFYYSFGGGSGLAQDGVILRYNPLDKSVITLFVFSSNIWSSNSVKTKRPVGTPILHNGKIYGRTIPGSCSCLPEVFEFDIATREYRKLCNEEVDEITLIGNSLFMAKNLGGQYGYGYISEYNLDTDTFMVKYHFNPQLYMSSYTTSIKSNQNLWYLVNGRGFTEYNPSTNTALVYTLSVVPSTGQTPKDIIQVGDKISVLAADGGGAVFSFDITTRQAYYNAEFNNVLGSYNCYGLFYWNSNLHGFYRSTSGILKMFMTNLPYSGGTGSAYGTVDKPVLGAILDSLTIISYINQVEDDTLNILATGNSGSYNFYYDASRDTAWGFVDHRRVHKGPSYGQVLINNEVYGISSGGKYGEGSIYKFDYDNNKYSKLFDYNNGSGTQKLGKLFDTRGNKILGLANYNSASMLDSTLIFSFDVQTKQFAKLKAIINYDMDIITSPVSVDSSNYVFVAKKFSDQKYYMAKYSYSQNSIQLGARFDTIVNPSNDNYFIKLQNNYVFGIMGNSSNGSKLMYLYNPVSDSLIYGFTPANSSDLSGYPYMGIIQGPDNNIYTTSYLNAFPSIIKIDPITKTFNKVFDFNNPSYHGNVPFKYLGVYNETKIIGGMSSDGSNGKGTTYTYDVFTGQFEKINDVGSHSWIYGCLRPRDVVWEQSVTSLTPPNDSVVFSFHPQSNVTYSWSYSEPNVSMMGDDTLKVFSFPYEATSGTLIVSGTNQCGTREVAHMPIQLLPPPSLVWPGDASFDGVVNAIDLLEVGLNFGASGIPRDSISNSFSGMFCPDWNMWPNSNEEDLKNVDCNGDGSIDFDDTLAINLNYGLSHTMRVTNKFKTQTLGDIYFSSVQSSYSFGQQVSIDVFLGQPTSPLQNFYGAAFTINYTDADNPILQPNSLSFSVDDDTWVGTIGIDAIRIGKPLEGNQSIEVGICKTDFINEDGFGKIGTLRFVTSSSSGNMTFGASNAYFIDNTGLQTSLSSSSYVINVNTAVGLQNQTSNSNISIYPNPNNGSFTLSNLNTREEYKLEIKDVLGRTVYADVVKSNSSNANIKLNQAAGVYWLQITSKQGGTEVHKVVVE
jgi:hypothetical protein